MRPAERHLDITFMFTAQKDKSAMVKRKLHPGQKQPHLAGFNVVCWESAGVRPPSVDWLRSARHRNRAIIARTTKKKKKKEKSSKIKN